MISKIFPIFFLIGLLSISCTTPTAEPISDTNASVNDSSNSGNEAETSSQVDASDTQAADADEASSQNELTEDVVGDESFNAVLLPKFMGIAVFDQANDGAVEASRNLSQPSPRFVGPTSANSVEGQIDLLEKAVTHGYDAVLISNNAGDEIAAAAQEAMEAGVTVVTWDSPIPSAEGESVFVAQVDFDETGSVMAEMAHSILNGTGKIAILSASKDAANQNAWIAAMEEVLADDPKFAELEIIDIVYGNDDYDTSYDEALKLMEKHSDLDLIMAPTTVGIQATAQAMQDKEMCDSIKTSGLGLPEEMIQYMGDDCVPEFALWSFSDLGYLAYHLAYQLANNNIEAKVGETFIAGRMGQYTIEKDPTRDNGLRVLMGSFTIYTAENLLWK